MIGMGEVSLALRFAVVELTHQALVKVPPTGARACSEGSEDHPGEVPEEMSIVPGAPTASLPGVPALEAYRISP